MYYARGGVLRLIMMFMICKMRTSDQGDIFLLMDKLIGFDSENGARVLDNAK